MKTLTLTVEKSRELDRRAVEDYGLPSFLLMENAGRGLSSQIEKVLQAFPKITLLVLMCGGGNNGGDGFVAARHIYLKHPNVRIYLMSDPVKYRGDALLNFRILSKLGLEIVPYSEFIKDRKTIFQNTPLIIIDCMVGTGLHGPVEGLLDEAIDQIVDLKKFHNAKVTTISADIPSGLDGDSGPKSSAIVVADITVAFGCIKRGLLEPNSKAYVGKLEVIDIGIPEPLLRSFSV